MKTETYEVVVIGGGAAGLSAALVLGRARRRVAVIDSGAPRNAPAAHMHGYLSRDGMSPADLLRLGREEASGYGVELASGEVISVKPGFSVRLTDGSTMTARRLLLGPGQSTSCRRSPAPPSVGAGTSSTVPTAMAGRCATSHSACSRPGRARSSTHISFAGGLAISCSSRTPTN